jgi:hypothetical protein
MENSKQIGSIMCFMKLPIMFEACRSAGIVAVSARQLMPNEKLMMKLTAKSQIEFGQARC